MGWSRGTGEKFKREGTYVYLWLIHVGVWQKPTQQWKEIAKLAMELFDETYDWHAPLRSFGVRTTHLTDEDDYHQMTLFENVEKIQKDDKVNQALDGLRSRYGYNIVMRGTQLEGYGDLCAEGREDAPHGGFREDL